MPRKNVCHSFWPWGDIGIVAFNDSCSPCRINYIPAGSCSSIMEPIIGATRNTCSG